MSINHRTAPLYNIIDGVYLSDSNSVIPNINLIRSKHIKFFIQLSDTSEYMNDINYIHYSLEDDINYQSLIIDISEKIYKIINGSSDNILIYSNSFCSCSCAVMIYYLMKQYKYTYDQAYYFIKNKISNININFAFEYELKKYYHFNILC
jgi:dual specificity protein phosphatase-like protein